MIKIYPVEIEAIDEEVGDMVFNLKTFDEYTATLKINTLVNKDNVDDLFISVKKAIELLELKDGAYHD